MLVLALLTAGIAALACSSADSDVAVDAIDRRRRQPTTDNGETDEAKGDEEGASSKVAGKAGFSLEFDAVRKIAQGLGVHLDNLRPVVEIKGETARLLSVGERTRYLFGKDEAQAPSSRKIKRNTQQMSMFAELEQAEEDSGWGEKSTPPPDATVLDRVHQAMILFAAGPPRP